MDQDLKDKPANEIVISTEVETTVVKGGRTPLLTDEVERLIVASVRSGAYLYVAAEAAGIHHETLKRWLRDERPRYRLFEMRVRQAHAQARMSAEIKVKQTNPLAWLRYGPGREKPGEPGWTESRAVTGPNGGPLQLEAHAARPRLDLSNLSNEELDGLDKLSRKLQPARDQARDED